jgi:Xaa-Pro aminopeptidase
MTATTAEAPFPPDEMAARLERVRRAMVAGGIDALIVLAPDSQYWLCGLESFISGVLSQALIVPVDDGREMVLVVWDAARRSRAPRRSSRRSTDIASASTTPSRRSAQPSTPARRVQRSLASTRLPVQCRTRSAACSWPRS